MIKTFYGNSIYADVKNALTEKGLGEKVYVYESNRVDIVTMLQNGTCKMPCVVPYVDSKYIISSSFDTYTTTDFKIMQFLFPSYRRFYPPLKARPSLILQSGFVTNSGHRI